MLQKNRNQPVARRAGIAYNFKAWKASRLSYHINVEPIPKTPKTLAKDIVCHSCDNDWCLNPKHLYLGTAKQNTKDMYYRNKFVKIRMSASKMGNTNSKGQIVSKKTRALQSASRIGNTNARGKGKKQMKIQYDLDEKMSRLS